MNTKIRSNFILGVDSLGCDKLFNLIYLFFLQIIIIAFFFRLYLRFNLIYSIFGSLLIFFGCFLMFLYSISLK